MKKKIIAITVIIVVTISIGWTLIVNKTEISERENTIIETSFLTPVKTQQAQKKLLKNQLELTGEFQAGQAATLIAESQGIITKLYIDEGDQIIKNAKIIDIESNTLESQLNSAKAAYEKALNDTKRYERLANAGAVSTEQLEQTKLALKNATANLSSIRQQLSFTTVSSPISGIINEVFIEEGAFVLPGNKLAEVIDVKVLKLIVKVSESDLKLISEGQQVFINTDAFPTKQFEGIVSIISYKADASKKFKVTIAMENADKQLRAGMFARASFKSGSDQKSEIVIPRSAIFSSMQNPMIFVARDGKAIKKEIKTGEIINNEVVVLAGVSEGEAIITSGQTSLKNNQKIKVLNH